MVVPILKPFNSRVFDPCSAYRLIIPNQKMGKYPNSSNLNAEECIYLKNQGRLCRILLECFCCLWSLSHPSVANIILESRMNKRESEGAGQGHWGSLCVRSQNRRQRCLAPVVWTRKHCTSPKRSFDAGRGKWTGGRMKRFQWYPFPPMTSLWWDLLMSPNPTLVM